MNFVFWLLIILAAVLIWCCLAFAFRGFGKFWLRLFKDVSDAMKDDNTNE